ncbi:hypothetical protein B0H63DRAFT_501452 [Podospora didyma]|uniref:Rhodopsin domain-containing protein n=1 Tax=Podospora didyma TaxID=330526 RepID=A0AAE0NQ28_9PEZI|nr:hypothetical protein B0H63DRAFT_501452 [Podospora didyma]
MARLQSPPLALLRLATCPAIQIAGWLLVSISGLFLALRIYCKYLKHRGLWWDDYVLVGSWLALLGDAIVNDVGKSFGFGMHTADIQFENLPAIGLLNHMAATFAIFGAVWSKTSFGLTLIRITEGRLKAAVVFIIVTMNLAMTTNVLTTWLQCNPIPKGWNPTVNGTCWDARVNAYYGVFAGVYSGVMDIVLACLPWAIVWKLQMKRKEKIGVGIAMSMGIFAGCAAFVKSSKIPLVLSGDFTYEGYNLVIWGLAEVAVAIMAASIPVLRVLIREVRTATRRRYGYGAESANNDTYHKKSYGTGALQRSSTVIVFAGHKPGRINTDTTSSSSTIKFDERDETGLTGVPQINLPGQIWQTQEITVRYHERDDADGMGRMV